MSETARLTAGQGAAPHRVIGRAYAWLLLPSLIAGIVAFAGIGAVRAALARFDLATSPHPYFLPANALLLYFAVPLATLGLAAFVMAPGLLLAAGTGRTKGPAEWLVTGLVLSMALLVPATTIAQLVVGTVLRGGAFLLLVAVLSVAMLPFPLRRIAAGRPLALDFAGRWLDLAFALLVPLATLLMFSAKFYWENFTPDGSGGLEFTRLYTATLWPFWPASAGTVAQSPDLTSFLFAVPNSWFVRAWGEYEYSVRAPMLLWLGLLHPLLIALIRFGRSEAEGRAIGLADHLLIGALLLLYTLALVYSGGYHPWFNDSPMPAVRETLALVAFLGYALFLFERRVGWMAACAAMSYFTIPTGSMWVLLVPLAAAAAGWLPPRTVSATESRPALKAGFLIFGGVVLFAVLAPLAIRLAGLPMPGYEFGAGAIIDRIRYVSLADWHRFFFLLLPGGIAPIVALFFWKRQDLLARTLTLTTLAFFAFFYFQGYRVLLHHFVPAMLLPAIVYWRTLVLGSTNRLPWRLAALGGIVLATFLAMPGQMRLHTADRDFAAKIATRGPAFATATPAPGERFHGFNPVALDIVHDLMQAAFPPDYAQDAPAHEFFGGPHVWYYYAQFPKPAGFVPEYDIRPLNWPAKGQGQGTLVARHLGYGIFVRDMDEYRRDRAQRLPYNTGAPLLTTDRDIIFGKGARSGKRIVIDLVSVARTILGRPAPARQR